MRPRFSAALLAVASVIVAAAPAAAVTLQQIQTDIDANLARSTVVNNTWSILVQNYTGTQVYYSRNPNTVMKPASNTKLFTTSAAWANLGLGHQFDTKVYVNGSITNGTLSGELILISEHDFTWSTDFYPTARTPLDQIAQQCYNLGLRSLPTSAKIIAKGCCVYAGTESNSTAASQFKAALQAKGMNVKAKASGSTGYTPAGTLFTSYQSLALERACVPLMKKSVNVYADVLCRHIGYKLSGTDTLAAGDSIILGWLPTIGISTTGMVLQDGSGLSHNNRVSATQVTGLLRYMLNNFETYRSTWAVGCIDGTLASRFCGTLGSGNVHGKTGTLTGVTALSGTIYNTDDHNVYLVSFLAGNVSDDAASHDAIDDSIVEMGLPQIPNPDPVPTQVIVDNDGGPYTEVGSWTTSASNGYHGTSSRYSTGGTGADIATWTPTLPQTGTYNVYAWYVSGTNRATASPFQVHDANGVTNIPVDQSWQGSQWNKLGTFTFNAGNTGYVTLNDNVPADKVVIADSIRFILQ
jgi:D-alanyl-D-alanine carboxypeptidase